MVHLVNYVTLDFSHGLRIVRLSPALGSGLGVDLA